MGVKLVKPSEKYKDAYLAMLLDWEQSGEKVVPFVLKMDSSNFKTMVEELKGFEHGIGIPETFVPHTTYWLMNESEDIVGVVNIRQRLNERLLKLAGISATESGQASIAKAMPQRYWNWPPKRVI